ARWRASAAAACTATGRWRAPSSAGACSPDGRRAAPPRKQCPDSRAGQNAPDEDPDTEPCAASETAVAEYVSSDGLCVPLPWLNCAAKVDDPAFSVWPGLSCHV